MPFAPFGPSHRITHAQPEKPHGNGQERKLRRVSVHVKHRPVRASGSLQGERLRSGRQPSYDKPTSTAMVPRKTELVPEFLILPALVVARETRIRRTTGIRSDSPAAVLPQVLGVIRT